MSITGMAVRRPQDRSLTLVLVCIPLLFLASGVAIRYLAFAAGAPDASFGDYVSAMCRWDCGWYLGLAEHGYEPFPMPEGRNVGSWGFFPLFPAVVAVVRNALDLPTLHAALLVSAICSYASCLLAWPLLEKNLRAYALYSAFVLSGPFSFHNMSGLTEGLMLLLMTVVFVALRRSAWLSAGLATALLSVTRLVGVFAVLALVVDMYHRHRSQGGTPSSFLRHVLARPDLLLAIVISPVGLFSYMLLLYLTVGDGLAFGHVQRAFGRVLGNPAMYLWNNLANTPQTGWWPTAHQWSGLAVITGLGLCAVLAFRRLYGAAIFCIVCIVLPITSGLASIVRYVAALVPLTTTLMMLLAGRVLFVPSLLVLLWASYFVTRAWFGGFLALV